MSIYAYVGCTCFSTNFIINYSTANNNIHNMCVAIYCQLRVCNSRAYSAPWIFVIHTYIQFSEYVQDRTVLMHQCPMARTVVTEMCFVTCRYLISNSETQPDSSLISELTAHSTAHPTAHPTRASTSHSLDGLTACT